MLKSKSELIQLIRFGISQLSAKNGHMEFEHICRFFSRARIHLNILPSTGPVQAGGDQGRDFETFHSYMAKSPISNTSFVGLFSKNPVAFACSLQKSPTQKNGKIEKDVKMILSSGEKVKRIYFFSGENIPKAIRSKKVSEIEETYNVKLEIIDAVALSEHLSDSDLFWIAVKYLDIPNEYIALPTEDNWYQNLKKEYYSKDDNNTSIEEFTEIKFAIRYIYKDKILKVDLPFWLTKLGSYISNDTLRNIKRKAIYEKFVAKLISQNNVDEEEDNIRDYFSDVEEFPAPAVIEDATCLLSFVISSKDILGHNISEQEIQSYVNRLLNLINSELKSTNDYGKKCWLIQSQAMFNLVLPNRGTLEENIKIFIKEAETIIPLLDEALFYPISIFSNFLNDAFKNFIKLQIDQVVIDDFERLIEQIDEKLSPKESSSLAGDRLRDRAVEYLKQKKPLQALNLLHKVKLKWVENDSPKGIVLCGLLIADCYEKLNLFYASKYYSLAVAHIVDKSDDIELLKYFPKAFNTIASSCYASGDWCSFFDFLDIAFLTNSHIIKDFNIYDDSEENISLVFYPSVIHYISKRYNLDIIPLLNYKLSRWGYLSQEIEEVSQMVKVRFDMNSDEEIQEIFVEQLHGIPFADFGLRRRITFEMYGSTWKIDFDNEYLITSIAEQFTAICQIYLGELYKDELFIIKSEIRIQLSANQNITEPSYRSESSNSETMWYLEFPIYKGGTKANLNDAQFIYVAIITAIIVEISLLPKEEIFKIFEKHLKDGDLASKATFGMDYERIYRRFISLEDFDTSQRKYFNPQPILKIDRISHNEHYKWRDEISPTYNQKLFRQYIVNRINFKKPFEITFPILKDSVVFLKIVQNLRMKNWLDWQIYMATGNIIMNFKIQQISDIDNVQNIQKIVQRFQKESEKESYIPIPISVLTEERIETELLTVQVISVLPSYGLENHSKTPNFKGVLELLISRFNYLIDGEDLKVFS